jgi:hypothetical protein
MAWSIANWFARTNTNKHYRREALRCNASLIWYDYRIAGLQDCKITGLQDCKITGLQDYRIAGLQDYKIARLKNYKII